MYPTRTELRARYIGVLIERMANKPYDPAACDHIEELLLLWRSSGEGR